MEKYTPIYLEFYSKQINLFGRKLLHWNVYPENLCWLLNSEPRKRQQQKDLFVSDALIEMVGDSSVDSSPWVPPDKYYNPGSHITLKCIIRQQRNKHTNLYYFCQHLKFQVQLLSNVIAETMIFWQIKINKTFWGTVLKVVSHPWTNKPKPSQWKSQLNWILMLNYLDWLADR